MIVFARCSRRNSGFDRGPEKKPQEEAGQAEAAERRRRQAGTRREERSCCDAERNARRRIDDDDDGRQRRRRRRRDRVRCRGAASDGRRRERVWLGVCALCAARRRTNRSNRRRCCEASVVCCAFARARATAVFVRVPRRFSRVVAVVVRADSEEHVVRSSSESATTGDATNVDASGAPKLTKKERKAQKLAAVGVLKQIVKKPELVEVWRFCCAYVCRCKCVYVPRARTFDAFQFTNFHCARGAPGVGRHGGRSRVPALSQVVSQHGACAASLGAEETLFAGQAWRRQKGTRTHTHTHTHVGFLVLDVIVVTLCMFCRASRSSCPTLFKRRALQSYVKVRI